MSTERRWNGWGEPDVTSDVSPSSAALLQQLIGPGTSPRDATLPEVLAGLPASRLAAGMVGANAGTIAGTAASRLAAGAAASDRLTLDPEARVRHARGQSLPDWIALRSGRLPAVPDAVARPQTSADVRSLLAVATERSWRLIPFGGGTSVVGGVSVRPSDRPVVSVDMTALSGLRAFDARSSLATFGAGTLGPAVEAALAEHGLELGHAPQSFEFSTVGGWVATRSSGQVSMGVGRIEALFAGGHLESPAGPLDLPPFPASAAGPDLRELVLGSEGRLGFLTEVIVRATPQPARDVIRAYRVPTWDRALELGRDLARSGLPLRMVRVSTPSETATMMASAGDSRATAWLRRYVRWRGQGAESCLVLVGFAGSTALVRATDGELASVVKRAGGIGLPGVGPVWRRQRFRGPYLRNALWAEGYAVDTLETAATWDAIPALAAALTPALRHGLESEGERVHAFSHLSHLYPSGSSLYVTYLFRIAVDPDETLDRWRRLKRIGSETIVAHGGTISHQHGVGVDHAPYLAAEKGPLGMTTLADAIARFDPDGILHRGVLLEDGS